MPEERSSDELRVAVTENIQTFSPTERALLQKLDCSIDNAFLEAQEFALYSVLGILLGMYADSFAVWEGPDSRAFVHATPQDTLTGVARIRLNSKRRSFRTIPDATVRITRLYRDLEKKAHHLVLVIEAKRLVGSHGRIPWNSSNTMLEAENALPSHIPQLMFQAFSAWSESPGQKCLYVGILIGPYLTALVFNHPPTIGPSGSLSTIVSPPHDASEGDDTDDDDLEDTGLGDDEHLYVKEVQHLCDVFPREHAPQLVVYMEHILKDPKDWRIDIIKSFEPGITQVPSSIFSSGGTPQMSYDVTTAQEETFTEIIDKWYKVSKEEKGGDPTEGEEEEGGGDDEYEDSDQRSSSPQVAAGKRKLRRTSRVNKKKRNRHADLGQPDLPD